MKSSEQGEYCRSGSAAIVIAIRSFRLEPLYKLSTLLYFTGYCNFDGRRVIDGLDGVGKLFSSLDGTDADADRLSRLVITVVSLDRS